MHVAWIELNNTEEQKMQCFILLEVIYLIFSYLRYMFYGLFWTLNGRSSCFKTTYTGQSESSLPGVDDRGDG